MSAHVGPVLSAGLHADAVVRAIRESCPEAEIVDHGSYVRVDVPGRCILTRESVSRHLGAPFVLPRDLEAIMPSFRGRLRMTAERAEWVSHE